MYITKETWWHPSCRCQDNSYATGSFNFDKNSQKVLSLTRIIHSHQPMGRVKTIWAPCVFRTRPSGPLWEVANWGYLVYHRKRLEPRVLPWQQYSICHSVSFVMYIAGAKFEEHCFIISRVILHWMSRCFSGTTFDVITFLTCIIQKREYLPNEKKICQKGKRQSSLLWKAFQIRSNFFTS